MLLHLLYQYSFLFVLASFILKPDAYDARTQARHFDELLFHESIGPRVSSVTCAQRVQLFLVQNGAHARRLVFAVVPVTTVTTMTMRV